MTEFLGGFQMLSNFEAIFATSRIGTRPPQSEMVQQDWPISMHTDHVKPVLEYYLLSPLLPFLSLAETYNETTISNLVPAFVLCQKR